MLTRRQILTAPLLAPVLATRPAEAAPGKMYLSMHQTTSLAAGYRASLEGYARAGIKYVEVVGPHLDPFVEKEGMPAAKRLLSDLGLTVVSHGGVRGLWEPGPARAAAIETMKHNAEFAVAIGADRMVCPDVSTAKHTVDDYKFAIDNMREAGDIAKQFNVTLMVEFTRVSTYIGSLPTSLRLTREAAHPNVRPMLDCYHFWSGVGKFEDLEAIRPGEIAHMHFQDVPDLPRETLDSTTREIPGTGVTPLVKILKAMAAKGYAGPLSVELFYPKYQNADPYEVARKIRENGERVMREAGVL